MTPVWHHYGAIASPYGIMMMSHCCLSDAEEALMAFEGAIQQLQ
jgi:hypothetical protein